jgi:hypothetical protein
MSVFSQSAVGHRDHDQVDDAVGTLSAAGLLDRRLETEEREAMEATCVRLWRRVPTNQVTNEGDLEAFR